MEPFVYTALPARVVFRRGARSSIGEEVERLGCRRAAVIATPGRAGLAEEIAGLLGDRAAGILAAAVMHAPVEVSDKAVEQMRDLDADCTVAVGGGSAIGLAKALALRIGLPQIALPTTYAGSEMTPVLGQTDGGVKTTVRNDVILPKTVLYDVELSLGLPLSVSATSGMNAIAHAIEALYAKERNPITRMQCLAAIEALSTALPAIMADPKDIEARSQALFGAFLCGTVLGSTGMALHHKLCHALGGSFDLPHAETHTVVLPHATSFNAPATDGLLSDVARILGADDPGQGLWDLAKRIDAPLSLAAIGMPEDGLERAADIATKNPYWNPRDFTREDILGLLKAAFAGERPRCNA